MHPFDLNAAALLIPAAWKVNWNHLENRRVFPDLKFESLLCLSLPPDFVLDFGWYLRDDHISYDLQINRGHFGWNDFVAFESFTSINDAISELQSWLGRLTASEAARANDHDLQQRLSAIDTALRCYFVPPDGETVDEILPGYMRKLILKQPSSWWQKGSSDASLHYRFRTGVVHSQLIFLQRDPHGFHIEYHGLNRPVMRCIKGRKSTAKLPDVEITLGGAPWTLPANSFVSPHLAAKVTTDFIARGGGEQPKIGQWEST
jgi:hypothetical protein